MDLARWRLELLFFLPLYTAAFTSPISDLFNEFLAGRCAQFHSSERMATPAQYVYQRSN